MNPFVQAKIIVQMQVFFLVMVVVDVVLAMMVSLANVATELAVTEQ